MKTLSWIARVILSFFGSLSILSLGMTFIGLDASILDEKPHFGYGILPIWVALALFFLFLFRKGSQGAISSLSTLLAFLSIPTIGMTLRAAWPEISNGWQTVIVAALFFSLLDISWTKCTTKYTRARP